MADAPDSPDEAADVPIEQLASDGDDLDAPEHQRRRRRQRLGRRTLAISLLVAMVASILAGLVASIALSRDGGSTAASEGELSLSSPGAVDVDRLLGLRLLTVEDEATTLHQQLGEGRTLVNLWQSTCTPCIKEMPLLEAARHDNPDVTFVGVATQDRLADAKKLAAQTEITYPWFQDPDGNLFYEAKGAGLPTTLLLAADGRVLATETGAFSTTAELQAFLDDHEG